MNWAIEEDQQDIYDGQVDAFELEVNGQIRSFDRSTWYATIDDGGVNDPGVFRIRAVNKIGASAWSPPAGVTLPRDPSVPYQPLVDSFKLIDETTARAAWSNYTDPAVPTSHYDVEIDGVISDVGLTTSLTIPNLTGGQTTTLRVRAVSASGSSPWSFARSIAPPTPLTGPPTTPPTTPPGEPPAGPPITIEPPPEPPPGPPTEPGQLFRPLAAPRRVVDTRLDQQRLAAGETRRFSLGSLLAQGDEVAAVSLNLTATNTTDAGYLTAYPCDGPVPVTSSVNFKGGEPGVPNHLVVPVGAAHELCVFAYATSDVVIDVDGWFNADAGVTPQTPWRALDSRNQAKAASDEPVSVAPAGALAALVNVTVAGRSTAAGYVTVYPCGEAVPATSTVNFLAGEVVANGAVVPVSKGGTICLYASTPTELAVDVAGYITDGFTPVAPTRLLDTRSTGGTVTKAHALTQAPPGTSAVAVNLTIAGGATTPGYATAFAVGAPAPGASTVNFTAGQVVANGAIVRPDQSGTLQVVGSTAAHFVVDVTGYFT